jgi:microcystin-dependent protein
MSDFYIGEIRMFPWSFAPLGWLPCDGRILNIQQNAALFSLISNRYGGDGKTTFALPDLRGRTPVGQGQPANVPAYVLGTAAGAESVTLQVSQVPSHTHALNAADEPATIGMPGTNFLAQAVSNITTKEPIQLYVNPTDPTKLVALDPGSVSSVGGTAHNNMQPFLAMNYCICSNGIYPSRP